MLAGPPADTTHTPLSSSSQAVTADVPPWRPNPSRPWPGTEEALAADVKDAIVSRTTERTLALAGSITIGANKGMQYAKSDGEPF